MKPTYYLTVPEKENLALEELSRHGVHDAEQTAPGVLRSGLCLVSDNTPCLAFIRQTLPECTGIQAESISQWSKAIFDLVEAQLKHDTYRWRLHIVVLTNEPINRRAELIRAGVEQHLSEKRRSLAKRLINNSPPLQFGSEFIVQVGILSKSEGVVTTQLLSVRENEHAISCFESGNVDIPADRFPPSRAYRKLLETELRSGCSIKENEACVDLGASPGGWSAIALQRGAFVTAVDRSPLREDLMAHPKLNFVKGDGFSFVPKQPVDWLLCDIIAYPERSLELLETWMSKGLCRHSCVTLKFQGQADFSAVERATVIMSRYARHYFVKALNNNKNEVTTWASLY